MRKSSMAAYGAAAILAGAAVAPVIAPGTASATPPTHNVVFVSPSGQPPVLNPGASTQPSQSSRTSTSSSTPSTTATGTQGTSTSAPQDQSSTTPSTQANTMPSTQSQSSTTPSTQANTTPSTQGQSPAQPGSGPSDDDKGSHGNAHHGDGCSSATYHTIQSAVDAVPAGTTIVVCAGTYPESVTITKQLTLSGRKGAIVDATGQPYGIGMTASWVTVKGMTVENASMANNAPGDGIITAGFLNGQPTPADHETIRGNMTKNNAGAGIDLLSTSYSLVQGNWSTNNGIGINVANDLGKPASFNTIIGNVASDNPGGCGIVLADHTGQGIFNTVIIGNHADNNGLGTPSAPDASAGSGILLAAGGAGGAWNNLIALNEASGNGHGGLALHAHAPGLNFSGNVMAFNRVGTNNLRQDTGDAETTGIYLGDASPLTIAVFGNTIHDNHFGIFTAGDITVLGGDFNHFVNVAEPFGSAPSYASAPGGPPGGGPSPASATAPGGASAPQGGSAPQGASAPQGGSAPQSASAPQSGTTPTGASTPQGATTPATTPAGGATTPGGATTTG